MTFWLTHMAMSCPMLTFLVWQRLCCASFNAIEWLHFLCNNHFPCHIKKIKNKLRWQMYMYMYVMDIDWYVDMNFLDCGKTMFFFFLFLLIKITIWTICNELSNVYIFAKHSNLKCGNLVSIFFFLFSFHFHFNPNIFYSM